MPPLPDRGPRGPYEMQPSKFDLRVAAFHHDLTQASTAAGYHWLGLKPDHPFTHPTMRHLAELFINVPEMKPLDLAKLLSCPFPTVRNHLYGNPNLTPDKKLGLIEIIRRDIGVYSTGQPIDRRELYERWKLLLRFRYTGKEKYRYPPLGIQEVKLWARKHFGKD